MDPIKLIISTLIHSLSNIRWEMSIVLSEENIWERAKQMKFWTEIHMLIDLVSVEHNRLVNIFHEEDHELIE